MEIVSQPPEPQAPSIYTGFAEIVADAIVSANMKVGAMLPASFLDEIVERVHGAHQVRVRMLEHDAKEAQKEAAAYAAMDRSNQIIMQYAKRVMGQTFEVNARQAAEIDSMHALREALRLLWEKAHQTDHKALTLESLQPLVEWEHPEMPPMPPTIVGTAVDTRYTHGTFQHTGTGRTEAFTFLGWSLVIRHKPYTTSLEPTFVRPLGEPATTLAMALDGWELQALH